MEDREIVVMCPHVPSCIYDYEKVKPENMGTSSILWRCYNCIKLWGNGDNGLQIFQNKGEYLRWKIEQ